MLPLIRWISGTATSDSNSSHQHHESAHALTTAQMQWLESHFAAKRIEYAADIAENRARREREEEMIMRRSDPWVDVLPHFRRSFPNSPVLTPRQLHDAYIHQMGLRPPPMGYEEARRAGYVVGRGHYAPWTGSRGGMPSPSGQSSNSVGSVESARMGSRRGSTPSASEDGERSRGRSMQSLRR